MIRPTQKYQLLRQFRRAGELGCTDEEAAESAGLLRACFWKRCGELRDDGLIVYSPEKRKGYSGVLRAVSVITPEGLDFLEERARE